MTDQTTTEATEGTENAKRNGNRQNSPKAGPVVGLSVPLPAFGWRSRSASFAARSAIHSRERAFDRRTREGEATRIRE
jgi:hypothetical protein